MIESIVSTVHSLLLDNIPLKNKKTPKGWISFNCPMCTDRRARGGIIQAGAKINYNCFNCGYITGWNASTFLGKKFVTLARKLGASDEEISRVKIQLLGAADELETLNPTTISQAVTGVKFEPVDIPDGTQFVEDLPDTDPVKQYAMARGILGVYPLLKFNGVKYYDDRLIIPCMYKDDIVGWSGRLIVPQRNKTVPKYLNDIPSNYVFNLDANMGPDRQFVIVTEGFIDAIQTDGVAVLSNKLSAEQAHLIERLNKRIILAPDFNEAGMKLVDQANALGWEVSFPKWPEGIVDVGQAVERFGRLATLRSIVDNAINNSIKIEVMRRLYI